MTIEQIRQVKWTGLPAADARLFFDVDSYVMDEENPLEYRVEALGIACRTVASEEGLRVYVQEARGY